MGIVVAARQLLEPPTVAEWGIFVIAALGAVVVGLICSGNLVMRRILLIVMLAALFNVVPLQHINIQPRGDVSGTTFSYRMTSTDIAFIAFAVAVFMAPGRFRIGPFLKPMLPGLFLCSLAIFSILVAFEPQFSAYEAFNLVRGLVIYIVFANAIRDEREVRFYGKMMIGVLTYFVLNTAFYFFAFNIRSPWGSPRGVIPFAWPLLANQKNHAASLLILFIPTVLALFLLRRGRQRFRLGWLLVACGGLVALVLTDSRAGQAAIVIGIMFIFVAGWIYFRRDIEKTPRFAILALIFIAGGIYFAPHVLQRIIMPKGVVDNSKVWRDQANSKALEIWRKHPVTGIGINNMSIWWHRHGAEHSNFAHNIYLLSLSEMGPLGPAALIMVFLVPIWMGWLTFRSSPSNVIGCMALGLTGTLVAMAAHGAYEPFFKGVEYQYYFWPNVAVIASCYHLMRQQQRELTRRRAKARYERRRLMEQRTEALA